MKKPGKCVHYNGTVNDCCAAGVNYKELAGPGEAWGLRLPCHSPEYNAGRAYPLEMTGTVAICQKREEPTVDELAAEEAWLKDRHEKIGKARAAIVAACGGPWNKKSNRVGGNGRIDCPACDGTATLAFSRSGYNGHIHANCSTAGCVSWME